MIDALFHHALHYFILALEIMGIFIILVTSGKAFYKYTRCLMTVSISDRGIKVSIVKGMALSLEFLLAAEILKTITIGSERELIVLAAIMALRIVITFVLHWEIKSEESHHALKEKKRRAMEESL